MQTEELERQKGSQKRSQLPGAELDPPRVGAGSPRWGPGSPSGGAGSARGASARRSSPLARQRVHRRPSGLRQRRWVCPSPVGTRELARSCVEAAELCAGLHRHLGRRSTSTSSRDPRELQGRHRGREAVVNASSRPHLDLVRFENRPAKHAAQTRNLGLPGREPLHALRARAQRDQASAPLSNGTPALAAPANAQSR